MTCVYSQRAMVVSAQEGMSRSTDSEVTASCVHQDVQLIRQRERFIKYVLRVGHRLARWANVMSPRFVSLSAVLSIKGVKKPPKIL